MMVCLMQLHFTSLRGVVLCKLMYCACLWCMYRLKRLAVREWPAGRGTSPTVVMATTKQHAATGQRSMHIERTRKMLVPLAGDK